MTNMKNKNVIKNNMKRIINRDTKTQYIKTDRVHKCGNASPYVNLQQEEFNKIAKDVLQEYSKAWEKLANQ